ncbi:MAG: general secretion pathway protein GspK, partial [bacterium]|nr:general secretion pathway protein GspK [bacterium]
SKINVNKIIDEKGKTNTLLYEITKNLFSILGYSPSLLDYFLDWIDEDSIPRPFGGEDFTYTINGFNYTPPNRNILVLREILLINGYTKEILYGNEEKKGLINFITIYTDGKININTCKGEILNSMGFTKEQVSKILEEREIHPLDEGFLININRDVFLKNRSLIKYKSNCFHVLVKVKNKEGEEAKNQAILEKEKTVNFIKKGIL